MDDDGDVEFVDVNNGMFVLCINFFCKVKLIVIEEIVEEL